MDLIRLQIFDLGGQGQIRLFQLGDLPLLLGEPVLELLRDVVSRIERAGLLALHDLLDLSILLELCILSPHLLILSLQTQNSLLKLVSFGLQLGDFALLCLGRFCEPS